MNSDLNISHVENTANAGNAIEANILHFPEALQETNNIPKVLRIKPKNKLTSTVKNKLKDLGCHYSSTHSSYVCPLNSNKAIEGLFDDHGMSRPDFTTVVDAEAGKKPQEISLDNQIEFLVKQIYEDKEKLHKEIVSSFPEKTISDFKEPPVREQYDSKHLPLANDFHKRYLLIAEKEKKLEGLREDLKIIEQERGEEHYGDFVVNQKGVYFKRKGKNEDEEETLIWLCSPIRPKAYLREFNNVGHAILFEINDGEKNHHIALKRKTLSKWQEIAEILLDRGQEYTTEQKLQKYIQRYLQEMKPSKRMRCVEKAGWHEDQYVFPDGVVVQKTNAEEYGEGVHLINGELPKGVKQKGTLEEWQRDLFILCIGNSRLTFSVGVALSAVVLGLVGEEGIEFNLKGRSSTGKSKCLQVAVSVYGSKDYMRSWRATANGLEGVCALHNDSLLALDEFGQSNAREAGEAAYMICNGVGKSRATKEGNARDCKAWRVALLSSGEIGLEEHMQEGKKRVMAGQLVRVIDVPAEVDGGAREGCFETLHDFKDGRTFADELSARCRKYYGHVVRVFVQRILDYGIEESKEYLRNAIDDFVHDNAKGCDGQVARVAGKFAVVASALSLAKTLGIFGCLSVHQKEALDSATKICYFSWLENRGTTGDLESHTLIDQVIGLLKEKSEGNFASKCKDPMEKERDRNTLWGYRNGDIFYVFPHAFRQELCRGYDPSQAAKALIQAGLLKSDSNQGTRGTTERVQAHFKEVDRFYVISIPSAVDG